MDEISLNEWKRKLEDGQDPQEFWSTMYAAFNALKTIEFHEHSARKGIIFRRREGEEAETENLAMIIRDNTELLDFMASLNDYIETQLPDIMAELNNPAQIDGTIESQFADQSIKGKEAIRKQLEANKAEAKALGITSFLGIR